MQGRKSELTKSGIYRITCIPTGDTYIGSSVNIGIRWNEHQRHLSRNIHHSRILQFAYNLYGKDAFEIEVVEIVDRENLISREIAWMKETHPEYNNNMPNLEKEGWSMSEESKHKISLALKNIKRPPFTEEHRRRIGDSNRRRTMSPETKEKIAKAHRGTHPSLETREKMSIARKARKSSPETIQKIKDALTGRKYGPLSDEQRQKVSDSLMGHRGWNKGKKWSDETIAKMVAVHKKMRKEQIDILVARGLDWYTASKLPAHRMNHLIKMKNDIEMLDTASAIRANAEWKHDGSSSYTGNNRKIV